LAAVTEDNDMAKILAQIPHLRHCGHNTQLLHLATGLARSGLHIEVVALQSDGPMATTFQSAGIPVAALSSSRHWDLGGLLNLRHRVKRDTPDLIHVWGLPALRMLRVAVGFSGVPILLSHPLATRQKGRGIGLVDRWLMRRCKAVAAPDAVGADLCRAAGIPQAALELVRPGVPEELENPAHGDADAPPAVLCVGPIERHKGFYEAIWAYDVLRFLHMDLQLWIVGDGPDLPRLQRFVAMIGLEHSIHFWGERPDIRPFLQRATALWVPSLADAGRQATLEAMASGTPVIASQLPGLAELIEDGKNGFLVPPGAKVGFGKKTKLLLDRPGLAQQMGEAGRQHVAAQHNAKQMVTHYRQLYEDLAA
jgi:glycosyltransferase involved in cell wall biosynthesis